MGKNKPKQKENKQNKQLQSNQIGEDTSKIENYEVFKYEKLSDDNYVIIAEKVLISFKNEENNFNKENDKDTKEKFYIVTTTKLRNLLAMISDIYNDVITQGGTEGNGDKLNADITKRINYLKVKVVYESGRDNSVRKFVDRANISKHLDDVIKSKSKADFILFCRYMEALVAYRKFYFEGDE
jgi:CRISPR-associated protein, csm2 family